MWIAPGEIVVDREWHRVQSPKFVLTVVWYPIGFHVLKALPNGRKFNAQHSIIIQMISWSQSQIRGGRPEEHGRTSWGCILIMLGHTPRNVKGLHRFQSNETGTSTAYLLDLAPSEFFLLATSKES
jgi:hypothetical protein